MEEYLCVDAELSLAERIRLPSRKLGLKQALRSDGSIDYAAAERADAELRDVHHPVCGAHLAPPRSVPNRDDRLVERDRILRTCPFVLSAVGHAKVPYDVPRHLGIPTRIPATAAHERH